MRAVHAAVRCGSGEAVRRFSGVACGVVRQRCGAACQRADKAEDECCGPGGEEGGSGAQEHEAYARCALPLQGEKAW